MQSACSTKLWASLASLLMAMSAALVSLASAPASAIISGTVLSGTQSPMWQTNNEVDALATANGVIYAGGTFTRVRPPGTAVGSNQEVSRSYLAAFNASNGSLITSFNVQLDGRVHDLSVSPDGSRLYLAGRFRTVNGATRNRIAAVNIPSGSLVGAFNPNANRPVISVDSTQNAVYLGGDFTSVGGTNQANLAAVSSTTGAVNTAFRPVLGAPEPDPRSDTTPSPRVNTIEVAPDGSRVLAGGSFNSVDGELTGGIVSLDPDDATIEQWLASEEQPINTNCLGRTTKILAVGDVAYVTAEGDPPGCYEGTYAARISDGQMDWNSPCLGASQGLTVMNSVLYKGSHQHDCAFSEGGAFGGYVGGTSRDAFIHYYLVGQDVRDGSFVHWTPNTNAAGNTSVGPHVMANDGDQVIVGGDFTRVNGDLQQSLTRFESNGNQATPAIPGRSFNGDPWPNTPPRIVSYLPVTVQPTAANTLTIEFPAVNDPDSGRLSYSIYRDNQNTAIATLEAESFPWSRPVLRYDDTGLDPGSTHTYRVSASDGTHTSARSTAALGQVASSAPASHSDATSSQDPLLWWRLGDNGNVAADSAATGNATGSFEGGVTRGQPGQMPDDAAVTLDGSTGYVASTQQISAPGAFSQSAWFKTTTTRGGVILAQSDQRTGAGGNTDRVLTLDNNGNIVFAMKSGQGGIFGVGTINTRNQGVTWNDGEWHQVVGTYDGNGNAALYVDGWLQGTAQGTPFDETAVANGMPTSYVRAGYADMSAVQLVFGINFYDNRWPLSDHLDGSIDEVAVYPKALTGTEVQELFAAGVNEELNETAPDPVAPTATFGTTSDGLTASFDGRGSSDSDGTITDYAWDFGDGATDTGAQAQHTYDQPGSYTVQLTVTDNDGLSDTTSAEVTVEQPADPGETTQTVVVENGSQWRWRYLDSDPGASWNDRGFDDAGWDFGNAVFGWGTDVDTSLDIYPTPTDRPRSAHFRTTFDVADASAVTDLDVTSVANDGVVIYVNGTEVVRENMREGDITYRSWADSARNVNTANSNPVEVQVPTGLLVDGTNVIAAETHVNYRNTRDVTFDLQAVLTTAGDPGPGDPVAPTATFGTTSDGLTASFDGRGSSDSDGTITDYAWDFGDGATDTGAQAQHTYDQPGSYTVQLTVTDNDGLSDTTSAEVTVEQPADPGETTQTVVVENGSQWRWRYLDSDPGASWNDRGFDDAGWDFGNAVFGWGTDVDTSLDIYPTPTDRPRSAHFRTTFDVADASAVTDLDVTSVANDGVVIYVNGTEVVRENMREGDITYRSWADSARNVNTANSNPVEVQVPTGLLVDGTNVIAAETHVNYRNTRDVTFDLQAVLTTAGDPGPGDPVAPTATFGTTSDGLTASFDGRGSSDSDGTITDYAWDFGDGATDTGAQAQHTYDQPGSYTVQLTVTDNDGLSDTTSAEVTVEQPADPGETTQTVVVENGSQWRWRYLDSDPGASWNDRGFDDAGWDFGNAVFGWGTDVDTSLDIYPTPTDRPRSAHFRTTFDVADASAVTDLDVTSVANDGVVIYVNGTEVVRENMREGDITYRSWADSARNVNTANSNPVEVQVPTGLLVDGTNVIAAETHVNYRNTRDVTFDLQAVLTTAG